MSRRRLGLRSRAQPGGNGMVAIGHEIPIVGFDLVKDAKTLTGAYNDAAGVTAKFNLNLLVRINRDLGAGFDLTGFCHRAFYNRERQRIEMRSARWRAAAAGARGGRLPGTGSWVAGV
jgi:uncharacterized SAM-dependent methyltransferase